MNEMYLRQLAFHTGNSVSRSVLLLFIMWMNLFRTIYEIGTLECKILYLEQKVWSKSTLVLLDFPRNFNQGPTHR